MQQNDSEIGDGQADQGRIDLAQFLIGRGYALFNEAWVKVGGARRGTAALRGSVAFDEILSTEGVGNRRQEPSPPTNTEAVGAEKDRRQNRVRKKRQRKKDKARGWTHCSLKVWDDVDARCLLSTIASRTDEGSFRAIVWQAVKNPYVVDLGARTNRLTGFRRLVVRAVLGPF